MSASAITTAILLLVAWMDAALGWDLVFTRSDDGMNVVRWAALIGGTAWFGYYCWRHS